MALVRRTSPDSAIPVVNMPPPMALADEFGARSRWLPLTVPPSIATDAELNIPAPAMPPHIRQSVAATLPSIVLLKTETLPPELRGPSAIPPPIAAAPSERAVFPLIKLP